MNSSSQPDKADLAPVVVTSTDTGIRFGMDAALFDEWCRDLSDEELDGFKHYGGNMQLAKFVCAFDYYTHRQRVPHIEALAQSYAAAFGLDPSSYTCRVRGVQAFEHPSVRFLLEQFATRSLRHAKDSALPKYKKLLDKVLEEGAQPEVKLSKRIAALDAGTRFMKMMQSEGDRMKRQALKNPKTVTGTTLEATGSVIDRAKNAPDEEPTDG